jgi:hypothetical protein
LIQRAAQFNLALAQFEIESRTGPTSGIHGLQTLPITAQVPAVIGDSEFVVA